MSELPVVMSDAAAAGIAITLGIGLTSWALSSGIAVIRRALGA